MKPMSNIVIPADETLGYERMEFADFSSTATSASGRPSSYAGRKKNPAQDVVLPTAAEIEAMQNQAREEGYQAGYAEGKQRMSKLLSALDQAMQQAEQDIAQDVLDLALEVARQMVQQTLKHNPEVLLNTIRAAINALPHLSQGAHLLLHPQDAEMIRQHIGEQLGHTGWKIIEDAQITPGGVRVETHHSQIDATVEHRWKRIVAAIGEENNWAET